MNNLEVWLWLLMVMCPYNPKTHEILAICGGDPVAAAKLIRDGGGDSVSALANAGVEKKFSYISTAGGAFLEWMEGKELPGVVVLKK